MTTSRLVILLAVLLGGLSTVFLLPKKVRVQPIGIHMELPKMVGGMWYGREQEVSEKERNSLGADTEFFRKLYTNARGDEILASVVLSGQDMNTSIHRPEWCLPAQGWTIAGAKETRVRQEGLPALTTTRLHNFRLLQDPESGKPLLDQKGSHVALQNLDYYWFVGYDTVTPSHLGRNLIDISDRLVHGYNQRWAFVTVAANVTKGFRRDGLDEVETDALLQEFIRKLSPLIHAPTVEFR